MWIEAFIRISDLCFAFVKEAIDEIASSAIHYDYNWNNMENELIEKQKQAKQRFDLP